MTITLYSAAGSGGVAVEAALSLLGLPYTLIEVETWSGQRERDRVAKANPIQQVPALVTGRGETITESGAILIHLADAHPEAKLAPPIGDPHRAQFLRWMFFVSSAIYAHYWIKDDPTRIGVMDPLGAKTLDDALHARILNCWSVMDAQIEPKTYLLGDDLSVLDLYVTVVSRFRPRRARFTASAPRMAPVVRRVDADPRLKAFWAERYPFEAGWDLLPE